MHRHVHRVLGSVYAYRSEIQPRGASKRRAANGGRRRGPVAPAVALPQTIEVDCRPAVYENLSVDQENAYFADGLTDEVTADLSKVRALRVISRTSSMTFKHTTKDVRTIARELGVRYVLEGSVRRAGSRLRITAQLIDATADDHVWSEEDDGEGRGHFRVPGTIARVIVDALEPEPQLRRGTAARRTSRSPNLHAYECYLRARQEGWRWRKDAIDHAVRLLRNGLEHLSATMPGLYAAMGLAHLQPRGRESTSPSRTAAQEAEWCAGNRSLRSSPSSASGTAAYVAGFTTGALIQEAVHDLKAALEIDGNNPDTLSLLLINCYLISGRVPASSAAHRAPDRGRSADPAELAACQDGRTSRSTISLHGPSSPNRRMFEIDPGNPMARLFYIWVLILNRHTEEIDRLVGTFPPEVRDTVPASLAGGFLAHAAGGDQRDPAHATVTPDIETAAAQKSHRRVFQAPRPGLRARGYA